MSQTLCMIIRFICMAFLASSLLASRRCHDAHGTEYDSLNLLFSISVLFCPDMANVMVQYDSKRVKMLSDRLLKGLLSMEHTTQNGDPEHFYPGCVNVSFAYVEGESLLMALKDIALSSGSACTSASLEPSYVLRALGSSDESAHSSIRFGIGRFTTESEIDYVLKAVRERVTFLRELSPLWELIQEGIDLNSIEWSQH
jgi:cysteine desulfurase